MYCCCRREVGTAQWDVAVPYIYHHQDAPSNSYELVIEQY